MASPHGKYQPAYSFTEVLISLFISSLLACAMFTAVNIILRQANEQSQVLDEQIEIIAFKNFLTHNPPIQVSDKTDKTLVLRAGFLRFVPGRGVFYLRERLLGSCSAWHLKQTPTLIHIYLSFKFNQSIELIYARQ